MMMDRLGWAGLALCFVLAVSGAEELAAVEKGGVLFLSNDGNELLG